MQARIFQFTSPAAVPQQLHEATPASKVPLQGKFGLTPVLETLGDLLLTSN